MVGTTGFEPATSRTPSVRATRLRHVPTPCNENSVSLAFEKGQDGEEFFVEIEEKLALGAEGGFAARGSVGVSDGLARRAVAGGFVREIFAGAGDGEAFFVEKALDLEHGLDVFSTVKALTARAFHRLEHGEFGFPEAQNEGFGGCEPADFSDAEKCLFGKRGRSLRGTGHS
jgi:hypothetical protein